jgi:hypothetical protein
MNGFLTRKNSVQARPQTGRARRFLTRKKWRDRDTPLGAKIVSARGPVHPALGIFGPWKFSIPLGSASDVRAAANGSKRGGKGMPL